MGIELTRDQLNAIDKAYNWYKNGDKQVFIISGYAGTGKSTVVKALVEKLGLENNTRYATFTGKASLVLNTKGNPAETLHKLMYIIEDDLGYAGYTKLVFRKKEYLDPSIRLIIVDEISMVSKSIMDDLLSFNVPIIGLGDPEQLPPIGKDNGYLNKPDVFLKEIHRQSEGNPIVYLSMLVRRKKKIELGKYGSNVYVIGKDDLNFDLMQKVEQVICGYNKTRQDINYMFRNKLGYKGAIPQVGDKIICTRNNWEEFCEGYPLINGTIGYVDKVSGLNLKENTVTLDFTPDYLSKGNGFCGLETDTQEFLCVSKGNMVKNNFNKFDYGYAITCHKSQGSEFNSVLLINEVLNSENHSRWLYTGITRAVENLVLVL